MRDALMSVMSILVLTNPVAADNAAVATEGDSMNTKAELYRRVQVPDEFLVTHKGITFGGDIRIGDVNGDGRAELIVYRCNHGAPKGAHVGGMKPCFLGAFDLDGNGLWQQGQGGNQPSRPMSVAVHDFTGDGAAEIVCFWHRPSDDIDADWTSLADVCVQIRDGLTGEVMREAAPDAITERRKKDPTGANWVHQRLLIANFRGNERPRDFAVKLGDTYVALDDRLNVLWTYRTQWTEYANCPSYIPAVGDIDGDGADELNGGYFVLDSDGTPLWERKLARNMDSTRVAEWDDGHVRAVCSGGGHVMDAEGEAIVALGEQLVPHGQEVRVADFLGEYDGPEMALRWNGHNPDIYVVASERGEIVRRIELNFSPTNVGMTPVYWNGDDEPAWLCNGGWLWDLQAGTGARLPDLPAPKGGDVHRMSFYHCIAADMCGDRRQDIVLWDPMSSDVYIYSPKPLREGAYGGYSAGKRQYNPRLMD